MYHVLITPPAALPVTLQQARLQLQLDDDQIMNDARILGLIRSATRVAEHDLGRVLMPQTWEAVHDGFCGRLALGRWPVQSVQSVVYVDADGAPQTLDPGRYRLDVSEPRGFVCPATGTQWPQAARQPDAVRVRFVAGYESAAAVPANVVQWILLHVEQAFNGCDLGDSADSLLDPDRVYG